MELLVVYDYLSHSQDSNFRKPKGKVKIMETLTDPSERKLKMAPIQQTTIYPTQEKSSQQATPEAPA